MSALLETNRGDILSGFHESARDFCREAHIVFGHDGVHLYGRDSANVGLVQYKLSVHNIEINCQGKYRCGTECIDVGINTKIVASCLSSVSCGDLVGFSINMDSEPDRLVIQCQNPTSGKKSCYKVIIPEVPDDPIARTPIESCGYNSPIVMSTLLFHDMLRDLTKSDATEVRVCCDGKRLVLYANGRHIKAAFEVQHGDDLSHFEYTKKASDRWPVCECFSIGYLQRVAKAKSLSQKIAIHLKPDFTIAFVYDTPLGALIFTVTPRDDAEWLETPSTRVMPPPLDDISSISPRHRTSGAKRSKIVVSEEEELAEEDGDAEEEEEEEEDESGCKEEGAMQPPSKKKRL
jgi:hypothetical protein